MEVAVVQVVERALALVAVVAIGQAVKRAGWVQASDVGLFARIVLRITLPCALVTSFDEHDMPPSLLQIALLGVMANLVLQVAGFLVARRRGRQAQAFAVMNLASFNMGAFATPYLAGFMGPGAVVTASLFDVGNSLAAAGLGYAWGAGLADEHRRTTPGSFLRAMARSVVFDVYLALVVMQLAHVHLPRAVITFTSTVGAANTFLAMLMVGIGLELRMGPGRHRAAARLLGIRYGLCAVMAVAAWHLPVPRATALVLVIVLFAPIAAMTTGFTDEVGGDVELSAFMTSLSILVGIVMMPLLLGLLGPLA